jgi:hypothetical protein
MAVYSVGNTALQGIQRGLQGFRRAAVEVADGIRTTQDSKGSSNFERALVEMPQQANQVKASVKVLQSYQDSVGTLLDIHA